MCDQQGDQQQQRHFLVADQKRQRLTRERVRGQNVSYLLSERMLHPYPISMQNPIDGAYRTLSAITKPTGKNRFEAGRNGRIIIARLWKLFLYRSVKKKVRGNRTRCLTMIRTTDVCLLRVRIAVAKSPAKVAWLAIVAKFLASVRASINGIVPIVQSQHRSMGRNSNRKLTAAR